MKDKIINKIINFLLNRITKQLHIYITITDFDKNNYKLNIIRNCKKITCGKILIESYDCIINDKTIEKEL